MNQVFGYARVSTLDQNLSTQLDALEKFGCNQIFQEKISGMATARPALDEMLSKLRSGDTVVVACFNRLGRNSQHLIQLMNDFAEKKIHFKALDIGIDTSTIGGKLVGTIFAALSDYERESILEKTKAGQQLAKSKGKHVGRPAGVNEESFEKVKMAVEKGMSVSEIVKLTGISISSVKRYRKSVTT